MEESEYLKRLGAQIKKIREEKDISQTDLGYRCNFERSNMNRIEAGKTNPTILTLKKIADALDVPILNLLTFDQ